MNPCIECIEYDRCDINTKCKQRLDYEERVRQIRDKIWEESEELKRSSNDHARLPET